MRARSLPLFACAVAAGFPSPADDYVESALDLNELVMAHADATFYVRVSGDSMRDASIWPGDILVVDRALSARHLDIVVALLDGAFTVKRLHQHRAGLSLVPANPAYVPILVTEAMQFQVWGVVTYCIHRVR